MTCFNHAIAGTLQRNLRDVDCRDINVDVTVGISDVDGYNDTRYIRFR